MSKSSIAVIAAGHRYTAEAARVAFEAGGNAFDAIVAAQLAACVVEPVLTSLGGGGFLVAHPAAGPARVYDFFVQTPRRKRVQAALDFYPVVADFGAATQEFHIGLGAVATPGMIKGLFRIHRDLCTLPLAVIAEPAVTYARRGIRITARQAYLFRVIEPILRATPGAWAVYRSRRGGDRPVVTGELYRQAALADTLEALVAEGERLFYRGEIARRVVEDCTERGGHLRAEDFAGYRVVTRRALDFTYRGRRILTPPPPSCGGMLVAFALKLLEPFGLERFGFGTAAHLACVARAIEHAHRARAASGLDRRGHAGRFASMLTPRLLRAYRLSRAAATGASGGTTHISIIDRAGNAASMSTSNGEGAGYVITGTGIMLNNMLGEQDINRGGFHRWRPNRRMASMMAPTLVLGRDGAILALGSGGSNRIRSAILQTIVNLIDFSMEPRRAVGAPRLHYEDGLLSLEPGFSKQALKSLSLQFPALRLWGEKNLFFGGVHVAARGRIRGRFYGAGDPRRGGVAVVVS